MEKQRWEESETRREEERRSEKRKSQKKEDAVAWKGRKVAVQCVFPMICGSGESKRRLAKAAGAEPAGQMRDEQLHAVVARSTFPTQNVQNTSCSKHFWNLMAKKCTPLWREAHSEVKIYKAHQRRTTFRSCDVEKVHAVVARSTFRSQNVQSTSVRAVLEVEMLKKWTPLWRPARFQVKTLKAPHVRTTFGRSDVVLRGRCAGLCTLSERPVRILQQFQECWQAWDVSRESAKMHFPVAGAVQETCSSEMLGGPGADFLRGVAFGRWFCVSSAALRMTWPHFFLAGATL